MSFVKAEKSGRGTELHVTMNSVSLVLSFPRKNEVELPCRGWQVVGDEIGRSFPRCGLRARGRKPQRTNIFTIPRKKSQQRGPRRSIRRGQRKSKKNFERFKMFSQPGRNRNCPFSLGIRKVMVSSVTATRLHEWKPAQPLKMCKCRD